MKLLFLLPELPTPPVSGSRLKVHSILSRLGREHRCDIIAFDTGDTAERTKECNNIAPFVRVLAVLPPNRGPALLWRQTLAILQCQLPALGRNYTRLGISKLREALESISYDAVHVDMIAMALYYRHLPYSRSVLSVNDAVSWTFARICHSERAVLTKARFWLLSKLAAATERSLYRHYRRLHVVSNIDAEQLRRQAAVGNVRVITLPVRDTWFTDTSRAVARRAPSAPRMFVSGHLDNRFCWHPLVEFVQYHWPSITALHPGAKMTIVGKRPHARLVRSAAAVDGVDLHEYVPNYATALADSDVVLFLENSGPSGIKTRLIQAMASAKAIVATDVVLESTDARDGVHCLIANTPSCALKAALKLIDSPTLRDELGRGAFHLARACFDNIDISQRWVELYSEVAWAKGTHAVGYKDRSVPSVCNFTNAPHGNEPPTL